jgi:protein-disulfide isomerase
MVPPAPGSQPGKKDRREEAREKARIEREAQKRRERRNKFLLQGGIGLAVVAIIIVVVLVVVNVNKPVVGAGETPKNMGGNGILFTGVGGKAVATTTKAPSPTATVNPAASPDDGKAHITTYVDWACPVCKSFEAAYSDSIQSLVASGDATLSVHPVAILDRNYAGSRYSSRAANAAACVANYDPQNFLAAQGLFYTNQPAEGSTGLSNSGIKSLLKQAGVTSSAVASCVDKESFKKWVAATTSRTTSSAKLQNATQGGFGTPTVFVNGTMWNGSDDFGTFLQSAVTGGTSTPTPTPTN